MENLENEIWKDIIGYEGLYQISNLGRIKKILPKKTIIMKTHVESGYCRIAFSKDKIVKKFHIHNLLAIHFLPNSENSEFVEHIDGNRLNNSLDNLRWKQPIPDLENEIWKDIKGYEGYYKISNLGRVKKLRREVFSKNGKFLRIDSEKLNKTHVNKLRGNYIIVDLNFKGKNETLPLHRLLAINFIPNPENKKYVNHIDQNPQNNSLENLEWVTNMENTCHAQKSKKNRTSKYIGVGWDKYHNKWKCQIYYNKKSIHIGVFLSEEEAYEARKKFEADNGIKNKYI
ncbi:MAG: NUMOD4 domain-containing protein [Flavobacterium sp.]|jgi:hypothetical protein